MSQQLCHWRIPNLENTICFETLGMIGFSNETNVCGGYNLRMHFTQPSMKNSTVLHRVFFFGFLLCTKVLARTRVVLEPVPYSRKSYIAPKDFKLKDYDENRTNLEISEMDIPPVDMDKMPFFMELEKSKGDSSELTTPEIQIVGFSNVAREYMTAGTTEYITMEPKTAQNNQRQRWHPIHIKDPNEYIFEFVGLEDESTSSTTTQKGATQTKSTQTTGKKKKCLSVIRLEALTKLGVPPEEVKGMNLGLMNCNYESMDQRFKMTVLRTKKDEEEANETNLLQQMTEEQRHMEVIKRLNFLIHAVLLLQQDINERSNGYRGRVDLEQMPGHRTIEPIYPPVEPWIRDYHTNPGSSNKLAIPSTSRFERQSSLLAEDTNGSNPIKRENLSSKRSSLSRKSSFDRSSKLSPDLSRPQYDLDPSLSNLHSNYMSRSNWRSGAKENVNMYPDNDKPNNPTLRSFN
ncbi:hypothetical protein NEMIN01_0536 [Nematocida minor]|uniref:uncharacterized protein n=1 Tax=Nematocida minor TaxID=1912983 RepID=UPI00221F3850|nr:uncharacterized protein NEMIN01_0536 [Nematocida minor]KAI5189473.1 hypothetical protein NEMIN01_0536 [Nematocida minor]